MGSSALCCQRPNCCTIGIREAPDVYSRKTGQTLFPGEVFAVSEVIQSTDDMRYLRLADGRGWAFTHSSRDGRLLCGEASEAEANEPPSNMQNMMRETQRVLASDPELREQLLASQGMQNMMANPEALQSMAGSSPAVATALNCQPEVRDALEKDSAGLMSALGAANASASQAAQPAG